MPYNSEAIRPLSLAIIRNHKNQILVSPGYDEKKGESFYRLLGGGIEFGESSLEALCREFKEELNVELTDCHLLKVAENIFSFNGLPGHELNFIYEAKFLDPKDYLRDHFSILDSQDEGRAIWLDLSDKDKQIIYPDISAWL
ncbi:MAG: NUDIX domain-containing protein [Candidatus Falkowbacteria bacterium]